MKVFVFAASIRVGNGAVLAVPPPLPHPFTHTRTHAHNPQEDEKLQADLRSLKAAQESYRAWVSKVLTVAATGRSLCVKAVR